MILIPDNLRLSETDTIDLNEINTEKLIVPKSTDLRKTINKLFDNKKFNSKIKSNNLQSLFNLSYSGIGITIVPFLFYKNLSQEKRNNVYHFKAPFPSREISIIYKRKSIKKDIIEEICSLIKKSMKSIEIFSDVKIIDTTN